MEGAEQLRQQQRLRMLALEPPHSTPLPYPRPRATAHPSPQSHTHLGVGGRRHLVLMGLALAGHVENPADGCRQRLIARLVHSAGGACMR